MTEIKVGPITKQQWFIERAIRSLSLAATNLRNNRQSLAAICSTDSSVDRQRMLAFAVQAETDAWTALSELSNLADEIDK